MNNLRFWQKNYFLVLAIFLVFFNGGILAISLINKAQADNAVINQALTSQNVLVRSLASDINVVMSSRPYAIQSVYESAIETFYNDNFFIEIVKDNEICISNLPDFDKKINTVSNSGMSGKRIYYSANTVDGAALVISVALTDALSGYVITVCQNIQASQESWNNTVLSLTAMSFVISLFLACALYASLAKISRPLVSLARVAENFAKGNHEIRAKETKGNDEIALLAKSLNHLANQTQGDMKELQEAADEKQRLVDALSHELRTPLTAIHGYAEFIQRASLSQEELYESTEYIMSESKRLEYIANELLNMAVMREDATVKDNVNLMYLFRDAYRTIMPKAMKRGASVTVQKPPNDFVYGSKALLESLFVNLMDNAVKACGENGKVSVKVEIIEKGFNFYITDNGHGMTAQQLEKIGKPFYRADKARSRAEGGAGLGLSLCYLIVQRHGGSLDFTSQINIGTTAKVFLPKGGKL